MAHQEFQGFRGSGAFHFWSKYSSSTAVGLRFILEALDDSAKLHDYYGKKGLK
jgi:hypothetical protein